MYDREVISRSIVSPIGSGATYEEVRDSIIEGFEQKVRSIVVAPFHVELLTELAKKYDNGYTRKGMILNYRRLYNGVQGASDGARRQVRAG